MSAPNLMTLTKRTSLNVYGADIFTCSRHSRVGFLLLDRAGCWSIRIVSQRIKSASTVRVAQKC